MALLPPEVLAKFMGTGYAPPGATYASAALSHGDPLAPGRSGPSMLDTMNATAPEPSRFPDLEALSAPSVWGDTGSLFERIMNIGQRPTMSKTFNWLTQERGVDPGMALLMVRDPDLLNGYIRDASKASQPIEVNGQLVHPQTGQVIGDYRTPDKPTAPISVGKDSRLFDPVTGQWIASPGGNEMEGPDFKDIAGVRKEIQALPSYKNYAQAAPIWSSLVDAEGRDTKASDLNFIYGIGKIFDPGSVVREGEMVMVENTASLPQRLLSAVNIVNDKGRLTPEMRSSLLAEAQSRMNAFNTALRDDMRSYRGIARRYGINPRDIIPKVGKLPQWSGDKPAPAPKADGGDVSSLELQPGAVIAGEGGVRYEYQGGDSKDARNWRRLDDPDLPVMP